MILDGPSPSRNFSNRDLSFNRSYVKIRHKIFTYTTLASFNRNESAIV